MTVKGKFTGISYAPDIIVARSSGVPIYMLGDAFMNAVSPDFETNPVLQEGNNREKVKIKPKKSWEIEDNHVGGTAPRMPRSPLLDFQPYRWIHLIDGDADSYWCSHPTWTPTQEPAWVRIDLPMLTKVKEIRLLPRKDGWGIPSELTIKVSYDACEWTTIYETKELPPPKSGQPYSFKLENPTPIRQVWIIANGLPDKGDWRHGRAFSLAEVEIINTDGENVALATRGAGVTVSSTYYGDNLARLEHDLYWATHYDLGMKWVRVAYWDAPLQWHYVEQEKGKYVIDPRTDEAVTETVENGCNITLCLCYGNWLYAPNPKKNMAERIWVIPHDPPPPPTTPEMLEGFLNFTRFMVKHFRDRIRYYEIWNEPNGHYAWPTGPNVKEFCDFAKKVAPVIKEVYPEAKVVMGAVGPPGRRGDKGCWLHGFVDEGIGPYVDVLSWHPFYNIPLDGDYYRAYPEIVRDFKAYAEERGFSGEYFASEMNTNWYTGGEVQKVKFILRCLVTNLGLRVWPFWCETWNSQIYWNIGLLRNTFNSNPYIMQSPEAGYYAVRTLCTVMAGANPTELSVEFSDKATSFECYSFQWKDKQKLVSISQAGVYPPGGGDPATHGEVQEISQGTVTSVVIKNLKASAVFGIDTFNGIEQELEWHQEGENVVVPRMRIRDYPIFLRIR